MGKEVNNQLLMIKKVEQFIKHSQVTPSKATLEVYLSDLKEIVKFIQAHSDEKIPLETALGVFFNHKPNLLLDAIEKHPDYTPELSEALLPYRSQRLSLNYDPTSFKQSHAQEDLPELTITRNKKGKIISYADPEDKLAHKHGTEAARIAFSTFLENIKAIIHRFFAFFHLDVFESARYQEHDYNEATIYMNDAPIGATTEASSYWIGHASNFIVIPTPKKPIHVLTDPVEGDLAPIIYSRKTREGKLIDGVGDDKLPKVDVVIISHNHRDHLKTETLEKLLKQQPLMVIPEGDLSLFQKMGFKHIQTLKWWEQAKINDETGETLLTITATPAKHWSGRGLHDAHHSAFMGYMLESPAMRGAIYFAGDTALMSENVTNAMFRLFNVNTAIQPGGPDERREDMESTHQSSADGIILHFRNLLVRHQDAADQSKVKFLESASQFKTLYDHTATFKLGNLRQRDTFYSYQRIVAMFEENRDESWVKSHLAAHEYNAFCEIKSIVNRIVFTDAPSLDSKDIAQLIRQHMIVPRIGQRLNVGEETQAHDFSHRDLIIHRRMLIEADNFTENYLKKCQTLDIEKLAKDLLSTNKHRFSRIHRDMVDISMKKHPNTAEILKELEDHLGYADRHSYLQNLVHYVKWVNQFKANPEGLSVFLRCHRVKAVLNHAIQETHGFFGSGNRAQRNAFMHWANELEMDPAKVSDVEHKIQAFAEKKPGFFKPKELDQLLESVRAANCIT